LQKQGAETYLFCHDTYENIPDAVFCHDWFSTHSALETGGEPTLVLYPMKYPNRRRERRLHIIELLLENHYTRLIDLTSCERPGEKIEAKIYDFSEWDTPATNKVLQELVTSKSVFMNSKKNEVAAYDAKYIGTEGAYLEFGALVLDRKNKIAYVGSGQRCSFQVAQVWKESLNYNELITFETTKIEGAPILETSLIFFFGSNYALLCLDMILLEEDKKRITKRLQETQTELIEITQAQAMKFCTCVCELDFDEGKPVLVCSTGAYKAFTQNQLTRISKYVSMITHCQIDDLEILSGGLGSVVSPLY